MSQRRTNVVILANNLVRFWCERSIRVGYLETIITPIDRFMTQVIIHTYILNKWIINHWMHWLRRVGSPAVAARWCERFHQRLQVRETRLRETHSVLSVCLHICTHKQHHHHHHYCWSISYIWMMYFLLMLWNIWYLHKHKSDLVLWSWRRSEPWRGSPTCLTSLKHTGIRWIQTTQAFQIKLRASNAAVKLSTTVVLAVSLRFYRKSYGCVFGIAGSRSLRRPQPPPLLQCSSPDTQRGPTYKHTKKKKLPYCSGIYCSV